VAAGTDDGAAMSNEGFLRRWARLKSSGDDTPAQPQGSDRVLPGDPELAATNAAGTDTWAISPSATSAPGEQAPSYRRAGDTCFESVAQTAPHPPVAPAPARAPDGRSMPTLEDVASLGPDSDFSAYVSQGVDKTVQRMAMKKLFSDPRFNVMDGLDIYIDDFNKADPMPAAMLASLQHAKSVFAQWMDDEQGKPPGDPGAAPPTNEPPDLPPQDHA
jgi:hypothetical protein